VISTSLLLASLLTPLFFQSGGVFQTNERVDHWPDGSVRARYTVDGGGRLHGSYVEFYENGHMKVKTRFRLNIMEGAYTTYHDNGKKHITAFHKAGILEGEFIKRSTTGQPQKSEEYKDGELHGTRQLFLNGKPTGSQKWEKGTVVRVNGVVPYPHPLAEIEAGLAAILKDPTPPSADELDPERGSVAWLESERRAALRRLQAYRFLLGLPFEKMELDPEFNRLCQAASRLLLVLGRLDHTPKNPGIPEKEYRDGYQGTSHSNLASGSSLAGSIDSYMNDSDPSNIDRVGHRRHCIAPNLKKTGFGITENFSAMWSMDRSGSGSIRSTLTAFPAAGHYPTGFFGDRHAWSITPLAGGRRLGKLSEMKVRIYNMDDEYRRSEKPYDIDHLGIAGGTLVFRPAGFTVTPGARAWVEISGMKGGDGGPLEYLVEFFQPEG